METRTLNSRTPFSTSDFWLSGALLAAGQRFIRLQWNGKRAEFMFENFKLSEAVSEAYFRGDLKVGAKAYSDALRSLKDQLFHRTK